MPPRSFRQATGMVARLVGSHSHGVDNNDQTKGFALKGALRATLDSIEEFRATTTNAGADQGRSSGAQVSILTKSGTNQLHGSAYGNSY